LRHKYSAFLSLKGRIGRGRFALVAISAAIAMIALPSAAQAGSGNQLQVTAMTYNLFQGSELTEASSATTPAQFLAAVAADYSEVQKTDQIVGTDPGSRSAPGGFWPSDHAGLIAELDQGPSS
jgi:hypothetical protein